MKNGVAGVESSKPRHAVQDRGFPSFSPGHSTCFVHFVREFNAIEYREHCSRAVSEHILREVVPLALTMRTATGETLRERLDFKVSKPQNESLAVGLRLWKIDFN